MTILNPVSGNNPGVPAGQNIPQHIVEQMMLDACIIHGLLQALEILAQDASPAVYSTIAAARPLAKKLASDLSLQW